jgi:hypothetical protein
MSLSQENLMRSLKNLLVAVCCFIVFVPTGPTLFAQHSGGSSASSTRTVELTPETSDITVGQKVKFRAVTKDPSGRTTPAAATAWFAAPFDLAGVDQSGTVSFFNPGEVVIGAIVAGRSTFITVTVKPAAVTRVDIEPLRNALVVGTTVRLAAVARSAAGDPRSDLSLNWASSNPDVAIVDAAGVVMAIAPGQAKITATAGAATGSINVSVVKSNLSGLSIEPRSTSARTGDVVHFNVRARSGQADNYAVRWTVSGPAATIDPDGGFVAESPGSYVVTAASGNEQAVASLLITPRDAERRLEVIGRAPLKEFQGAEEWITGNYAYL